MDSLGWVLEPSGITSGSDNFCGGVAKRHKHSLNGTSRPRLIKIDKMKILHRPCSTADRHRIPSLTAFLCAFSRKVCLDVDAGNKRIPGPST